MSELALFSGGGTAREGAVQRLSSQLAQLHALEARLSSSVSAQNAVLASLDAKLVRPGSN
jgi:hypothetical protein